MPDNLQNLLRDRLGITRLSVIPNRYAPEGYRFSCSGAEALDWWRQLRTLVEESGYWPVILGDDEETERILGVADSEDGQPVQEILTEAASQSAEQWLTEREQSLKEDYGTEGEDFLKTLRGEWPEQANGMTQFTIPYDRLESGRPKDAVTIGLLPTTKPWEIAAILNFGGWNECPDPAAHVRMMKSWSEMYQAEAVGMNGDVVEMYAAQPPGMRDQALTLATQQFLYCSDIVTQGTETIDALAAGLLGSHIWYFWWD